MSGGFFLPENGLLKINFKKRGNEMTDELKAVVTNQIAAPDVGQLVAGVFAIANELDPRRRYREAHKQALLLAFAASGADVNLSEYTCDDFPREGCSIVIELLGDSYRMRVYAPSFVPHGAFGQVESYSPRKLGSLGIALDAFARGKDIRSVLPEMSRAENAYEFKAGSTVSVGSLPDGRVPAIYLHANWLCTTPLDPHYQEMGIGFTLADGNQVRLRLARDQAQHLSQSIAGYCADS